MSASLCHHKSNLPGADKLRTKAHLLKRSKDKKIIKEEKRHDQENISCGFSVMSEVNTSQVRKLSFPYNLD